MNTPKSSNTHKFDSVEQLLHECEQDLQSLQQIQKTLEQTQERYDVLVEYYQNDYMADVDNRDESKHYRILDQDSIWNVLTDQDQVRMQMIKQLVAKY